MTRDERERTQDGIIDRTSRRTLLKTVAATGGLLGFGGIATAQAETYRFVGKIGGWIAQSPSGIEGQTNPTLELQAGTRYRVVWENADGFGHNFVIVDADGNQIVRSEVISEQGATQTVEFTATEEMAEYFCEIHPGSMRGDVSISGRQQDPEPSQEEVVPAGPTIGLEPVAQGLTSPIGFAVAPGDDRRFIVEQTGQILVHDSDGLRDQPFLDISDRIVELGVAELEGYDERGLLGLAFHPEYEDNRRFYVHYSAPPRDGTPSDFDHTSVIAEFRASEDGGRAEPDSERAIMEIPSPQMNHNGGDIAFGPDGYLYIGIGDGGAADDVGMAHVDDWYDRNEGGNGQDVEQNLLGSILRIDVDASSGASGTTEAETTEAETTEAETTQAGTTRAGGEVRGSYAVPEDNPLVGEDGLDEHYAWGFRNPRSLSFDDEGRLFVADAGQNLWEEVNLVEKGGNYGWNVREGTHCFSTDSPSDPEAITDCPRETPDGEPLLDPIIEYRHRESTTAMIDGSVVVGGYMYENDTIPELQGTYVFGNWSGTGVLQPDGEIFVATPPESGSGTETETETETEAESGTETETETETETATAGARTSGGLWSLSEAQIAGSENDAFGRYVLAFGRDAEGELYVLSSTEFTPTGTTGAVHKLVPAGEGATVTEAETETEAEAETETETETEATETTG